MYCLKCGRDTKYDKIFCEDCLNGMDEYPIKPGTAIQLPQRTEAVVFKKAAKHAPTPEERISSLRRTVAILIILLILVVTGAAVLAGLLFSGILQL